MNTLFFTDTGSVMLNDNNEPVNIPSDRESISRIYKLNEDTKIVYMRGTDKIELEGKAGQILVLFYAQEYKNKAVIVDSEKWAENIDDWRKEEQRKKEEWAKTKSALDSADMSEAQSLSR